ncbi:MAG: hypothetical protein LBL76_01075 [Treponema sp.]|jgi:hypothetical protein|nr:hypothetical protein [Treponema sp.]
MCARIELSRKEFEEYFSLDRLVSSEGLDTFSCSIEEYNVYLVRESLKSQDDMIAVTYLLHEKSTKNIVAYMSLIADAIKLHASEKELHQLGGDLQSMMNRGKAKGKEYRLFQGFSLETAA